MLGFGRMPPQSYFRLPTTVLHGCIWGVLSVGSWSGLAIAEPLPSIRIDRPVPVVVRLKEDLGTSRTIVPGETFVVECVRDVVFDSVVVVRAGAPGTAYVSELAKANVSGAPASIKLSAIDIVSTDGTRIALAGNWNVNGSDLLVENVAFFPLSCLLPGRHPANDIMLTRNSVFVGSIVAGQDVRIIAPQEGPQR